MGCLVTRGLVLREVCYKESDKILTLLLEGEGKQTANARGCRRNNSSIAAAAQILVWSEMTLTSRKEKWFIKEAATLREFRGLRGDLERLSLGCYFAEAAEAVAEEGVEIPGLLPLVLNALHGLDCLPRPLPLMKAAFELKLTCLAGYEPMLDACAICGRADPENPRFHPLEGVLYCEGCRGGLEARGASLPLDLSALRAARHVVYGDPKRLFSFDLPPGSLELFSGLCEGFLLAQLDRGFRTLEFYKGICPKREAFLI